MATNFLRSHNEQLVSGLIKLYDSKSLTDITLIVEGFELPCHRVVLAARSPYFRAMFSNQLTEAVEGKARLWDVEPETLSAVIDFIYKGNIQLSQSNVQEIFTAASLFEMIGLQSHCAVFMMSQLDITNCVDMYQFASFHSCEVLKNNSKEYVVGNFSVLARGGNFNTLGFRDFDEILSNDDLNVSSEEQVYEAMIKWIEADIEERLQYLEKLFLRVRLLLLLKEFIDDEIYSNEMIMSNDSCVAVIHKAETNDLSLTAILDRIYGVRTDVTPRLGMHNRRMLVFAGGHEKDTRALTAYDPVLKRNHYAIPLHVNFDFKYRIDYHRLTVTPDNELFFIGGIFYEDHHFEEAGPALNEVRHYDPIKKSWALCAPLQSPRCAHSVVSKNNHIYAIGGKSTYPGGEPLCSVERYSIYDDEWCYVSSMPRRLYHHCSVVHGDKIIVIGGATLEGAVTKSFLEYDIESDTWSEMENTMSVPRAEFGAVILENKLFVIAGVSEQFKVRSVEIYDFGTKRWRHSVEFIEDRKSMVAVAFDGCIYVCGGVKTVISRATGQPRVVETKDLWKFDPTSQKWNREAKIVQYANIHACVVAVMNTRYLYESEFSA